MSKTCNNCGDKAPITTVSMSSGDWQKNEQRHERREKRLVWVIVLLIVLIVGSNICWIAYENSFDDMTETYTVEQDGAETNNSVINGGVIN